MIRILGSQDMPGHKIKDIPLLTLRIPEVKFRVRNNNQTIMLHAGQAFPHLLQRKDFAYYVFNRIS